VEYQVENTERMSRATLYTVTTTADENMFVVSPSPFASGSARTHVVLLQDGDLFPDDVLAPVLNPSGCTCEDYRFKKAEHLGWCKHRIAVAFAEGSGYMRIVGLMNPIRPVLTVSSLAGGRLTSRVMNNLDMSFENEIGRVVVVADATSVEITLFPKGGTVGIPLLVADTRMGVQELGIALGVAFG